MQNKVIYKYEVSINHVACMPKDAFILKFEAVGRKLFVWAKVSRHEPNVDHKFLILNTGDEVPSGHQHLDTVLFYGGDVVKHIFKPVDFTK